ncbi:hypothetical protein GO986_09165 [Deinococcus sp. HMF7620]|uniref:Uncharacterized protein n=1 Tax=Deinococcus arboris TaxID=2682977 RepID=A0A7C9HRF3_9DEIO|nr:hypothetical protein [Deinococcus arboris]MVN86934.1 hypothetical protein [Deinococcus arboris]
MADDVRNVYVYDVVAINRRVPEEGEGSEFINEDVDPMVIFDSLEDKVMYKKSAKSSGLNIDGRFVGINVLHVHEDYVEGAFYAEKTHFSGTIVSQTADGQTEANSLSSIAETSEIYELAYFIYDPQTQVLAIERNRDVPYEGAFEKYAEEYCHKNSIDVVEFQLHPRRVISNVDKIMAVQSVDKIYLKMPSEAISKLNGDDPITTMVKDIGKAYSKLGSVEITLCSEKSKLSRSNVFQQVEIRDFWLENQDHVTKLIVNKEQNEEVYFGSNQIVFKIRLEKNSRSKDTSALLKKTRSQLKDSDFRKRGT